MTGFTILCVLLFTCSHPYRHRRYDRSYGYRPGVNIGIDNVYVDMIKEVYRWSDTDRGPSLISHDVDSAGWPVKDCMLLIDRCPLAAWNGQRFVYGQGRCECGRRFAFWNLGGNIAVHFFMCGPYRRYGCYGLTDDITNTERNDRFQAVRQLIGEGK
jgi:hypothetical protein